MHPTQLNADYWETRYQEGNTPWDIGGISPPLQAYLDAHTQPDDRILIPGAGHAYEAIYLHRRGYQQVWVCDWAEPAFDLLRREAPDFPADHLLVGDFFELKLEVDLILEQTFFCAIAPSQRPQYVQHAHRLLRPGGKLAGLLFAQQFPQQGPPFGGSAPEYRQLFASHFAILQLDLSPLSIGPRLGRELFVEFARLA